MLFLSERVFHQRRTFLENLMPPPEVAQPSLGWEGNLNQLIIQPESRDMTLMIQLLTGDGHLGDICGFWRI